MKKFAFKQVHFLTSAKNEKGYPKIFGAKGEPLPEIAVAGRSNVGKSSLLNHLFGLKSLVKTSQNPGKTRLLNFFQVDDTCIFCDLPGYGYANVKQEMKKTWGEMIESYIEKRASLKLILLLLDSRRVPSKEDIQFFEWVQFHQIPMTFVFTKVDKLSKGAVQINIKKNLEILGALDHSKVLYSVPKKLGRKELIFEIKAKLYAKDE